MKTVDKQAQFRFYEELNDFLPADKRKTTFFHPFFGTPSIKDVVESIGVPHTEVDLILINGDSVGFDYRLQPGDRVSVYPVFESLDISPLTHLRKEPWRNSRFILDVHLGKTAKILRMLGFDTLYRNDYHDREIADMAIDENRIILTRDKGLLKIKEVTRGYWLRSVKPDEQIHEILNRFDLFSQIKPFHRCLICNGRVKEVEKEKIADQLQEKTKRYFDEFYICAGCGRVYWKGSHYDNMEAYIDGLGKKA
ncbi:MAG: Mut7-C ubiquitin/RNAse domain-containing protein [Proteobacteria bacterium]|nr:Mut7-C ubiquitin/RNAse domain-containing protein [Pseudomonadota bacterium]